MNTKGDTHGRSHLPTSDALPDPVALVEGLARDLSTVTLIRQISVEGSELAQKEVDLAKTELKADLKAEAKAVGGLGLAFLAASTTINVLLVTVILALARIMPGWAAGLLVSGFTLAAAGIVGFLGWNKRVRSLLARTRRILREDVVWAKQRLARAPSARPDRPMARPSVLRGRSGPF